LKRIRIWNSAAFKVWVLFGFIGLLISLPLGYYFNSEQRSLLQDHTREEFENSAEVASAVIQQAIINEDFALVEYLVSTISKKSGFEYIAIVEDLDATNEGTDSSAVFACYPDFYYPIALERSDSLIYSESEFISELISGRIIITTSASNDEIILSNLNAPFRYLIIISIIATIILFALSLRFLTKPIYRAVSIAQELENQNYSVDITLVSGKTELDELNNALFSLKEKLQKLQKENNEYKNKLEEKIEQISGEIKNKNSELIRLNEDLEKKVLEKTKSNLEMSNSLIGQEKLVLLGEISSGIAHDLNTPLGSIKASNDSVRELLFQINAQSQYLTEEASVVLTKILNLTERINPFPRNAWVISETKKIEEALSEQRLEQYIPLAKDIASVGIGVAQKEIIYQLLDLPNVGKLIPLVGDYLVAIELIRGINQAVTQSSSVISNLNKFIKQNIDNDKQKINLSKSISILETLFKFRFKDNLKFSVDIDSSHSIYGIETELYQVWSNLLKNALDALDTLNDKTRQKKVAIYSEEIEEKIYIHFENNGPEIPPAVKDKIFKKYFTTKKDNGTGLGLSIVSKIISDHYGKMEFSSSAEKTIFTVVLPSAE